MKGSVDGNSRKHFYTHPETTIDLASALKHPMKTMNVSTNVRDEVFSQLLKYLSLSDLESIKTCTLKLLEVFPHQREINRNRVLVAYGGGKDSSYMLAFVRMMQLGLYIDKGETFQLRVATNRHAGMPVAVMENIDRIYSVLKLYQDPDVETLLIDDNEVSHFDLYRPLPPALVDRNRLDILMSGHLTQAQARPTFCNACNISMVNSFGVAASYGDGVDVIVTGDSLREQRAYTVWINRLNREINGQESHGEGFQGFLDTMSRVSQSYFEEIYGENAEDELAARKSLSPNFLREPSFFSIYNDTDYSASEHWELLTHYLQFQFTDLSFSFSESDCANPGLMAHLRGLKCERVYGRSYYEGIQEYAKFGLDLMVKKQFPALLIEKMKERYGSLEAVAEMRAKITDFALFSFGITEEQLICMVYAPFTERGKNLEIYLKRECPELLPHLEQIHALLGGQDEIQSPFFLTNRLYQLSGLHLQQLRVCYASSVLGRSDTNIVGLVLERDPHKATIVTRYSPYGPTVNEMISGR
ncbi:MAG: hypothetical protein N5P05_000423 [Chroococcopsis gigantea SAG 12.99]|jgi:hypothetical protein|nr:hypothetical protein [Chroococcopsis gigantea SAG 12.99]